jgi:hypothetical protein
VTPTPKKYANATLFLAGFTAAIEVWLATIVVGESGSTMIAFLGGFLFGPLGFLALLAWRRKTHPTRVRMLFWVTVVVAIAGMAVLGWDSMRERPKLTGTIPVRLSPLLVASGQWLVVLAVWARLVFVEGKEKRATASPEKKP